MSGTFVLIDQITVTRYWAFRLNSTTIIKTWHFISSTVSHILTSYLSQSGSFASFFSKYCLQSTNSDTADPSTLKKNLDKSRHSDTTFCHIKWRDKWNIHEAIFPCQSFETNFYLLQSTCIYFTMLTYRMSVFSYSVSFIKDQKNTALNATTRRKSQGL